MSGVRHDLLIDLREALEGSDNNTCMLCIDGITQLSASIMVFFRDGSNCTFYMFKTKNGFLELSVEYSSICDDEDTFEDVGIVFIVE